MLVTYRLAEGRPSAVAVREWARPSVITTSDPSLWPLVTLAMLLLPPILGCLLYLRLRSVTQSAPQRSRILVMAVSIPLWLVVSVSAYLVADPAMLQIGNRLLGVAIALVILKAALPIAQRPSSAPPSTS